MEEAGVILAAREAPDKSWETTDNPDSDGWSTEAFDEAAGAQLDAIGNWLANGGARTADLEKYFAATTAVALPKADVSAPVFDDGTIRVRRPASGELERLTIDALAARLQAHFAWFAKGDNTRHKFKIFEVEPGQGGASIAGSVDATFVAQVGGKVIESHAVWRVRWDSKLDDNAPRLSEVVLAGAEEAESSGASATLFSDCTAAALGGTACYEPQILRGLNHWLPRVQFLYPMSRFAPSGAAVADVNGDGLEDLYLCQESGLPNRLFLQRPDGTVEEVSREWGVDWIEDSRGVLLLDLDNDGDQDLVVSTFQNLVIASNEEGKRFEVRRVLPASESLVTLCAADFDRDGDLDIYVCGYAQNELLQGESGQLAFPGQFLYTDANNGGANSLFRNDISGSGWDFVDVTVQVGLDAGNRRWSYAATWEDYDNDGDQDLYVANDFGRNNLFRNDGGTFVDVAATTGAEDSASGMSTAWADFNRDGFMDLYVGNMWSSAGRRIVEQNRFKPGIGEELRGEFRRFARGNSLLQNVAGEHFKDVSELAGVTLGRWAWSSPFVDVNNDGWEDLVVANGYITGEDPGDL